MKNINNQFIKLKEYLNEDDYKEVGELQELCFAHDKTALKLELDYKLSRSQEEIGLIKQINEFLYYDGQQLVGYLGISCFGGSTLEVNGMVHPDYRRNGVFSKLFQFVKAEWDKRGRHQMLLLTDRLSASGQAFVKTTGARYKNSEYEMYLNKNFINECNKALTNEVALIKATNKDAKEVTRQNAIYFGGEHEESHLILPEDEEKNGMTIYLVMVNEEIIGKVHLQIDCKVGGIYGVGVLPEHRSQGYGRKIILKAIEALKALNVKEIMLQVATQNANALNLYKSCGFEETSTMDYYEF